MKRVEWWVFAGATIISFVLAYWGVVAHDYPTSPGDDIFVHLQEMQRIAESGIQPYGQSYPPGFHAVVVAVSQIFQTDLINALRWTSPALIPLAALALYGLIATAFNRRVALLAYVLFIFTALQPIQTYYDGSLPNIFATGILLPIAFLCFVRLISPSTTTKKRFGWAIGWILATIAILLTHHLSSVVYGAVMTVWASALIMFFLFRRFSWWGALGGVLVALLLALSVFWLLLNTQVFGLGRGLVLQFIEIQPSTFPYLFPRITPTDTGWDMHQFGRSLGGLIFQFSFLGIGLAVYYWRRLTVRSIIGVLLLVSWFGLYYVGSQTAAVGEPTRLARDLIFPATALSALAIIWLYDHFRRVNSQVAILFVAAVTIISLGTFWTRVQAYTNFSSMVRFSPADQEAYSYLLESGESSRTKVITAEQAWPVVVELRKTRQRFYSIDREPAYRVDADQAGCYLVGWYLEGVWPADLADRTIAESYLNAPNYQIRHTFQDQGKELFLSCRFRKED